MSRLVTLIPLYNGVAGTSVSIDSNLTSTAELVGHVDGTLKDLTCNKMLSVLNEKAKGFIINTSFLITD